MDITGAAKFMDCGESIAIFGALFGGFLPEQWAVNPGYSCAVAICPLTVVGAANE
jgi:hypothetical protein